MASDRNYRIDIYINQAGQVNDVVGQTPQVVSTSGGGGGGVQTTEDNRARAKTFTAYSIVSPILNGAIQGVKNKVDIMNSNSELSERVNIGLQGVSMVNGVARKVAMGWSLASALGVSVTTGGTIGLLTFGIESAVNIALKQQQINLRRAVESEQQNITIGRMGTQFNGSRGVK